MGGGGSAQQSQKHPKNRESITEWVQISMTSQRKAQLRLQRVSKIWKARDLGSEIWGHPQMPKQDER